MNTFTIHGKLPGLNEYIHAINKNRHIGNALKHDTEDHIVCSIFTAMRKKQCRKVLSYPVKVYFEWHEKTRRRDLDNIASAKKFILDAMQSDRILHGDGQKYVCGLYDTFVIPDTWDGVVVTVEEPEAFDKFERP